MKKLCFIEFSIAYASCGSFLHVFITKKGFELKCIGWNVFLLTHNVNSLKTSTIINTIKSTHKELHLTTIL